MIEAWTTPMQPATLSNRRPPKDSGPQTAGNAHLAHRRHQLRLVGNRRPALPSIVRPADREGMAAGAAQLGLRALDALRQLAPHLTCAEIPVPVQELRVVLANSNISREKGVLTSSCER